ncbi:hypothetical protein BKI52_28940 [marine bacterium AO1-C]|nr:hypothetical protein BKI52_28940 [marine bacterium AO1-C]
MIKPMNWNTTYHIYEGIALLLIVTAWGAIIFGSLIVSKADYQSVNIQLEKSFQKAFAQNQNALDMLCLDVEYQGSSREGRERIHRGEELSKRIYECQRTINSIRNRLPKRNAKSKDYIVSLFNEQVIWINKVFDDLTLPHFEKIALPSHFINSSEEATKTLLLTYQLKLGEYQTAVLRKLGAFELAYPLRDNFSWYPTIIPHTKVVQVGNEYAADVFDGKIIDLYNVRYFVNDQFVKNGSLQFKPEGNGQRHLNLTVQYRYGWCSPVQQTNKKIPYTVLPK